ncbi:MAG: GNAT family N-acetyltransferase [Clostridiales bacterium]|nr:GNAT family N-acetyltransferase [Clostridiales bacterium]
MKIRKAEEKDIRRILELLSQILELHAKIRPDIFISGTTKYSAEDIHEIISDENRLSLVAADDNDRLIGYALCIIKDQPVSATMVSFKSLFIDDLCVDSAFRGQHVGTALFECAKQKAKELGCYELTLNVWEGNEDAKKFYEKMKMTAKETQLELIL